MNETLWEQAELYANHPYEARIEQDELTDGRVVFVAFDPALPGCKAQGSTAAEARGNLRDARIDYIYALLELDLPIPAQTT